MTLPEFTNRYHYNPSADKLGAGGFGQVYKAYDTLLDKEVAIKMAQVIDGKENLSLMKEVELAKKLPIHANVAHYQDCFRLEFPNGTYDVGVLQYYPEGSLATVIKKGNLTTEQRDQLINGILNGLDFLHKNNVMHRDMKPGNILISKRGDQYIPKIADFGLSRQVESFDQSSFVNSFAGGSAYYAAPEQLAGEKVRANVDLWSFGVILYELMTGDRPFTATAAKSETEHARQEIYAKIQKGNLPLKIYQVSEPYQTMIKRCLTPNRTARVQNVSTLLSLLNGRVPSENDLDKTNIDNSFSSKEQNIKSEETKVESFAKSPTTSVNQKKEEAEQANQVNETKVIKNKRFLPILIGGIGILLATIAYYITYGSVGQVSEQKLWITALEKQDLSSYKALVVAYPNGQYTTKANKIIDSLNTIIRANQQEDSELWSQTKKTNTIAAYQSYQNSNPQGQYITEATKKIKELKASQSIEEAAAQKKAEVEEDKAWKRCDRKKEIKVYQDYLKKYPAGKYANQAQVAIDNLKKEQERIAQETAEKEKSAQAEEETFWKSIQRQNTVEAYKEYQAKYPRGSKFREANTQIESISDKTTYANQNGGKIALDKFKSAISAGLNCGCDVMGFEMLRLVPSQDPVSSRNSGATLNAQNERLVKMAKVGNFYMFYKIKVKCPGESASRISNPLVFEIMSQGSPSKSNASPLVTSAALGTSGNMDQNKDAVLTADDFINLANKGLKCNCPIIDYQAVHLPKRQDPILFNKNTSLSELAKNVKPADMFAFYDIEVRCANQSSKSLANSLFFRIK